jgi:hypothetical protein
VPNPNRSSRNWFSHFSHKILVALVSSVKTFSTERAEVDLLRFLGAKPDMIEPITAQQRQARPLEVGPSI